MEVKRGIVTPKSMEESKNFNKFFEEVQQIDEKGVRYALMYRLNAGRDFNKLFYKIIIEHAELNETLPGEYSVNGFGYALSEETILKIKFVFDVNDFYKNSVEIEKRFEEV